jgi:hypothetical protein
MPPMPTKWIGPMSRGSFMGSVRQVNTRQWARGQPGKGPRGVNVRQF